MKTTTLIHATESQVGDSALISELAGAYGTHVLKSALRIVGKLHLAEEVQQDVFVKLLADMPQHVRSWPALLATMATRTAIDHLRAARRLHRLSFGLFHSDTAPGVQLPEQALAQEQRASQLRDALSRLRRRDAQAFCLHYFNGFSGSQIGAALGVNESNANVIVHRARRRLTQILSQTQQERSHDRG